MSQTMAVGVKGHYYTKRGHRHKVVSENVVLEKWIIRAFLGGDPTVSGKIKKALGDISPHSYFKVELTLTKEQRAELDVHTNGTTRCPYCETALPDTSNLPTHCPQCGQVLDHPVKFWQGRP